MNGDLKQDTLIGELVVGIAGLVSAASDLVTLEPGDLILTGTPAGVGLPRDTFLAVGDVVEVEIGGIGRIVHTIISCRISDGVGLSRRRSSQCSTTRFQ